MQTPTMLIRLTLITLYACGVQLDETTMRWVDHIDEDMDIFFDRAVIISIKETGEQGVAIAPGVLIDSEAVLTSFNPFREHIKHKEKRKEVTISLLYERSILNWKNVSYVLKNYTVDCARQIIPVQDMHNIWNDDKKLQSPLHDLMVIRLNESLETLPTTNPAGESFYKYSKTGNSMNRAGPYMMDIAKENDALGRDLKFASLGFRDSLHIKESCELHSHTFSPEDNVATNCDGWIPRSWGIFICIHNVENFKGLGSGALLVHKYKLFGIGSFVLSKGEKSILVFTDVRPYFILIHNACSLKDQKLGGTK
ncbi:Hemocytin [Operophtera brumata]|uniref:Hemocytin n=1 Tax=Operophtera brumata TaxID=104452 RepID=A0A0L7KVH3_OPEBR|nr:Hemocytin [Operophtera brumata]